MASPSNALLFCCTACCRKGSIVKQLYELQSELVVAQEQRLVSTRAVDEVRDLVEGLKADKVRLQAEVNELREVLYKKGVTREYNPKRITAKVERVQPARIDTSDTEVGSVAVSNRTNEPRSGLPPVKSESDSDVSSDEETGQAKGNFKHPKAFRELRFRVDKFTGNIKEVDFNVWLEDFLEATNDCGWNDADRQSGSHGFCPAQPSQPGRGPSGPRSGQPKRNLGKR